MKTENIKNRMQHTQKIYVEIFLFYKCLFFIIAKKCFYVNFLRMITYNIKTRALSLSLSISHNALKQDRPGLL